MRGKTISALTGLLALTTLLYVSFTQSPTDISQRYRYQRGLDNRAIIREYAQELFSFKNPSFNHEKEIRSIYDDDGDLKADCIILTSYSRKINTKLSDIISPNPKISYKVSFGAHTQIVRKDKMASEEEIEFRRADELLKGLNRESISAKPKFEGSYLKVWGHYNPKF